MRTRHATITAAFLSFLTTSALTGAGAADSHPIRLNDAQMDQVTAGALMVSAEGSALAVGDNSLAVALTRTSASQWKVISVGYGESSTVAAGDLVAYIENTNVAATDTMIVLVEGEALGIGDAIAAGQIWTFTVDTPVTDVTVVNGTMTASGSIVASADVTAVVGVSSDSWLSGNITTTTVSTPRFTKAMVHGAVVSHTIPVYIASESHVKEKILQPHATPQTLSGPALGDGGRPQHIVPKSKVAW